MTPGRLLDSHVYDHDDIDVRVRVGRGGVHATSCGRAIVMMFVKRETQASG